MAKRSTSKGDASSSDEGSCFQEGDLVFELGIIDLYVTINDEIEMHRAQALKRTRSQHFETLSGQKACFIVRHGKCS